jgi:23S rRNA (guanosine2251-2'-O)-methyltransferase
MHVSEWLWGVRSVEEAIRGGNRRVHEVWMEAGPANAALDRLRLVAQGQEVPVRDVDSSDFAGLDLRDAQRVAARCGPFAYQDEIEVATAAAREARCFVVVLDHLEDPQNFGAIVRTADASGCKGIFIPRKRAVAVTPAVVRASAGATEHVAICRVGNVVQTVDRLKELGYWTVALDAGADTSWSEIDYCARICLVMGAEGRGVHRLVSEHCDHRVSLPMHGEVGSLNVSAAFAAIAYEVLRQQAGA